jgi:hypothetical protein
MMRLTRNRLPAIVSFALAIAGLGCKGNKIGQMCDLTVDAGPSQAVVNMKSGDCPTGICLKAVQSPTRPEQSPPTGATCTAECSSDSDCDGQIRDRNDPLDTRCLGGFLCGVAFVRGPLCCKKYCLCKDFLGPSGAPTPIACQGPDALTTCQSAAGSASAAGIGQQTDLYISVAPVRKLDLVFMIDNSPSMAPKVAKMNAQFPRLLETLKDSDGYYPDLRVAIIDSDLGTGGQYTTGNCGPKTLPDGTKSLYGDLGRFQMLTLPQACTFDPGALFLEYKSGAPVNYPANADISQIFACLAGNLGAQGCGEEHQLQAFEFALAARGIDNEAQQAAFLRANAYLGLVFLTDEDDCSAATNDGMFGDKPELTGESSSLRCATRAHMCNGANLTSRPPGYPTSAKFEASFAACAPRTDACPSTIDGTGATDTSQPTACSPLTDFRRIAEEMKNLRDDPYSQLLVAGIFGWPRSGPDGKPDMANATYKIDLVPNPDAADTDHPQIWDYWPVCYDPDHLPKTPGAFDADAWGWGAQGGLRLSAFIDEFGDNGLKYSICEPDFTQAMHGIGNAIAKKLQNLCVDAKLMDVDLVTPGLQPDCRVVFRVPQTQSNGTVTYVEDPQSLPYCLPGATPQTVTSDCWQLVYDTAKCPGTGQLITIVRTAAEIAGGPLTAGTKIGMQCWTCPDFTSAPGCTY